MAPSCCSLWDADSADGVIHPFSHFTAAPELLWTQHLECHIHRGPAACSAVGVAAHGPNFSPCYMIMGKERK